MEYDHQKMLDEIDALTTQLATASSDACSNLATVTYDGYTYDLVAIGDQCWFAENLRNEYYANGDAIPGELSDGEWSAQRMGDDGLWRGSSMFERK